MRKVNEHTIKLALDDKAIDYRHGDIAEIRRRLRSKATAKRHIHLSTTIRKPKAGKLTPAEYRRQSKAENRKAKEARKIRHGKTK